MGERGKTGGSSAWGRAGVVGQILVMSVLPLPWVALGVQMLQQSSWKFPLGFSIISNIFILFILTCRMLKLSHEAPGISFPLEHYPGLP